MATAPSTGNKKARELLTEAEAAWGAIQANPLDAVITVDDRGIIRFFNRAAQQIFGYTEKEAVGRNVSMLVPEPHRSQHDKYISRFLKSGVKKVVDRIREEWAQRKDGTEFPIEMSVVQAHSSAGQRFVGVIRDITKRREAQDRLATAMESLHRSNADLEAVLNQLKVGVCAVDESGTVRFASLCCREFLELAGSEPVGRRWNEVLPFDKDHEQQASRMFVNAVPGAKLTTSLRGKDGSLRMIEVEVRPDPRNPDVRLVLLYDQTDLQLLRDELDQQMGFHDLVGKSDVMRKLYRQIEQLARFDTTVLIEGETGVGKELVARALHDLSPRKPRHFVPVNTAGLSESLLASQLFGHVKGAFTGAAGDSKGVFETAHRGTLFLDEAGDIPLAQQSSLLRALQETEIVRVGESVPRKVDVRVIAATNRDLELLCEQGLFRQDLRYRLSVAVLHVPPLRERIEDIPGLAKHFLRGFSAKAGKRIDSMEDSAMRKLTDHHWPGNVRELKNALEVALIRCTGNTLREADLVLISSRGSARVPPQAARTEFQAPLPASPGQVRLPNRRRRLIEALTKTAGNRAKAARLLGIGRTTLYRLIQQYGIEVSEEQE